MLNQNLFTTSLKFGQYLYGWYQLKSILQYCPLICRTEYLVAGMITCNLVCFTEEIFSFWSQHLMLSE